MWAAFAPYGWEIVAAVAVAVSVAIGFMEPGRDRLLLILGVWLIPLWIALWSTATDAEGIAAVWGDWWVLLAMTPIVLGIWAAVTIFPYVLTARLREIRHGM